MSAHRVGGLTYRIMQWSTGKHLSVLAASKGGPRSRGHPAFDPPAGDVTERDYEAERIRVTKHFVEASAYCIDVGAYRESALRWRKDPGKGWVHGIYTNYVPEELQKCTGTESGREVAEEKKHMGADEAVHANQSEYVADQVTKRLRASGMFGAPQETLSLQDAKDLGEQLTREGKAPVEAAPTTPPSSKLQVQQALDQIPPLWLTCDEVSYQKLASHRLKPKQRPRSSNHRSARPPMPLRRS